VYKRQSEELAKLLAKDVFIRVKPEAVTVTEPPPEPALEPAPEPVTEPVIEQAVSNTAKQYATDQ